MAILVPQYWQGSNMQTSGLPASLKIAGRAYAYFEWRHAHYHIQNALNESSQRRHWLENFKWFIEKFPYFCARKSEITTFYLVANLSDDEITELEEFVANFQSNYWRSLDTESLDNLRKIIQNEKKFRLQPAQQSKVENHTSQLASALAQAVQGIQLKSYEESQREELNGQEDQWDELQEQPSLWEKELTTRKQEAKNYLRRLTRRYTHIRREYKIHTNQNITKENAHDFLKRFFDVHFGEVQADEEDFLIPEFEDMWASIDDTNIPIAHLLLVVNAYLNAWNTNLDLTKFVDQRYPQESSRNMAIVRFVEYVFQKEYERRKDFESRKNEAYTRLDWFQMSIGECQKLIDQVRSQLDMMTINYI